MIEKIKKIYADNRIWLYLLKYIFISIVVSIIAIAIDTRTIPLLEKIPSIFLTSVDLAKVILSTLAGALLTITTFTFSTIMVVLTMYSSDFSPRVVNNFLTDKISMKVLGVFVGGFFYCIIALFFMKNSFSEYLVLSATIGVIYAVFSIIYFIVFIYRVSSSIQATKLIKRVYDESFKIIEDALSYKEKQENLSEYQIEAYKYKYKIKSKQNGYLQLMNIDSLVNAIENIDSKLVMHSQIGDFVGFNQDIATLYYNSDDIEEDIKENIINKMTFGSERLSFNDYKFSLQKIVDIALRAISPGINDPNTAIHCINILSVLLGKLSRIKDNYTVIKHEGSKGILIYEDFNFREDLYFTFYQIVYYGKKDISVLIAIFEALNKIGLVSQKENLEILKEFSDYVYDVSIGNFDHKFDQDLIEKSRYRIEI
ncbi:MAG: DUF2254 domain-containing protein [Tissierella sp.]|uniref:DUF2254 domain-containing protein n=1 Tax=Tissierella sp. TaxID=41274 RepID=UPI003F9D2236